MGLDTSIPFRALATTRLMSADEHQQNALARQMQQMQLQQMQSQQEQQKQQAETQNALAKAMQDPSVRNSDGSFNYNRLSQIVQPFDVNSSIKYDELGRQQSAQQADAQRRAAKDQLERAKAQIDLVAQVSGAARDQGSYEQGVATLRAAGLDVSGLPPTFDPNYVRTARMQALTAQQQLDQEWKARGFDLDTKKFEFQKQDAEADRAVQMRGQNMTDARARQGLALRQQEMSQGAKAPTGYRFKADGSLEAIPGGPAAMKPGSQVQAQRDAQDLLELVQEAEPLVDKATGSYGGVAIDEAARVFGRSTAGADNAAKLKAIEGAMLAKVPKMSGPQSDKDVALYKQMVGRIGDPTVPPGQKKAALNTIKLIQKKYANRDQAPAPAGGSQIKFLGFE